MSIVRMLMVVSVFVVAGMSNGQGVSLNSTQYSQATRQAAIDQLLMSAQGTDPYLRANAIEASQVLPDRIKPLVQLGVSDEHAVVRFASAVVIGKLRLVDLTGSVRPLVGDANDSVKAAAIFALKRCGADIDLSPLAGMLMGPNPYLRSNVLMLLAEIGDESAIGLIKHAMRIPMPKEVSPEQVSIVKIQAAEALVMLGAKENLDVIRAVAVSMTPDEARVLAVRMVGRLEDRQLVAALKPMVDQPPIELQLASAESLALLGFPQAVDVPIKAVKSENAAIRAQAAIVLGRFPQKQAVDVVSRLLVADSSEQVRLAAAASVLGYQAGK